jgi:hypothetical protein
MASLGKISTLGELLNLELAQGASLQAVRHTLTDPDTLAPLDLTGCTARGQIRHSALDTAVLVSFRTRIAPVPTEGWYEFWLTDEDTMSLPCGPKIGDPASQHEYDVELEDIAGNVIQTFRGTVSVKANVTRP